MTLALSHIDHNDFTYLQGDSCRAYHAQTRVLIEGLRKLQENPPTLVFDPLDGLGCRDIKVHLPICFIIGDAPSQDRICGKYVSYGNTNMVSRCCDMHRKYADIPLDICRPINFNTFKKITENDDNKELKKWSLHKCNNAFYDMDFGEQPMSVHGATPPDVMHSLQHGLMAYTLESFFAVLTKKDKLVIEATLKCLLNDLRCSSQSIYPRFNFPNGITNLAFVTAKEHVSIMCILVMILSSPSFSNLCHRALMLQPQNSKVPIKKFSGITAQEQILIVFGKQLGYNEWVQHGPFWCPQRTDCFASHGGSEEAKNFAVHLIKTMLSYTAQTFVRPSGKDGKHSTAGQKNLLLVPLQRM